MEDFLASLPKCQVQVDGNIVDATRGFAACEFAESVEADLLVLPGYNRPQGRVPPLADWALQVVPCSLWIVQGGAAGGNPSCSFLPKGLRSYWKCEYVNGLFDEAIDAHIARGGEYA
jgi:hypothetical protein